MEWFERELAACRALAGARLTVVDRWDDPETYPFPFAAPAGLP